MPAFQANTNANNLNVSKQHCKQDVRQQDALASLKASVKTEEQQNNHEHIKAAPGKCLWSDAQWNEWEAEEKELQQKLEKSGKKKELSTGHQVGDWIFDPEFGEGKVVALATAEETETGEELLCMEYYKDGGYWATMDVVNEKTGQEEDVWVETALGTDHAERGITHGMWDTTGAGAKDLKKEKKTAVITRLFCKGKKMLTFSKSSNPRSKVATTPRSRLLDAEQQYDDSEQQRQNALYC